MEIVTTDQLRIALISAASEIIDAEPYLTQIDTIIGDGDHGMGMKTGFSMLKQKMENNVFQTPYDLFHESSLCLIKSMGGASGVLFGTFFIGGLEAIKNVENFNAPQLSRFLSEGVEAVQRRGRAKPGDKTMVDALFTAKREMNDRLKTSYKIEDILEAALKGAVEGAENTKSMLPHIGRSKNFREKAIGWPDPGAISVSLLFRGLYNGIIAQI